MVGLGAGVDCSAEADSVCEVKNAPPANALAAKPHLMMTERVNDIWFPSLRC
jgi:hypothetical protein